MQKKIVSIFSVIILLACLTICGCKPKNDYIYDKGSKIIYSNKTVEETYIEEIPFILLGKLQNASGYIIESSGETVSKKAFIKQEQNIYTKTVKSGKEYYFYSESTGFLNSYHKAFFTEGKVVYGDSKNINGLEMNNVGSCEDYSSVYGFTPIDQLICGYTINEETVLSCEKINRDIDVYTFKFVLDVDKAPNKMKVQMQTFGGLNGYPEFEELSISAIVDNNWTVKKIITESKYKISIKVLGNVNCDQRTEGVFSYFNGTPEIENAEEYRNILK